MFMPCCSLFSFYAWKTSMVHLSLDSCSSLHIFPANPVLKYNQVMVRFTIYSYTFPWPTVICDHNWNHCHPAVSVYHSTRGSACSFATQLGGDTCTWLCLRPVALAALLISAMCCFPHPLIYIKRIEHLHYMLREGVTCTDERLALCMTLIRLQIASQVVIR